MGSYPLLSQAPTPVEVELGCDNTTKLWLLDSPLQKVVKKNHAHEGLECETECPLQWQLLGRAGGQRSSATTEYMEDKIYTQDADNMSKNLVNCDIYNVAKKQCI